MKLTFDVPDDIALGLKAVVEETIAELTKWPQKDDPYYFITSDGGVVYDVYDSDFSSDKDRLEFGNMFKTREEAEFKCEQLKVLHELEQLADDNQPWDGCHNKHWYINCTIINRVVEVTVHCCCQLILQPYCFKSEESAIAAIKKIGEERLKKYYFCIPEDKT